MTPNYLPVEDLKCSLFPFQLQEFKDNISKLQPCGTGRDGIHNSIVEKFSRYIY